MTEILTFSQRLVKVMQKHRLTAGNLSTLIGGRADLKHVLADDASHVKRVRLYNKLVQSQLFDQTDYEQLSRSLEISRLGVERYRFQYAIDEILAGHAFHTSVELLTDSGLPLSERLNSLQEADKIELICFNSCYHGLFSAIAPLFANPQRDISMRHYIQSDSSINVAAEYIAVVMPILFDSRYSSYYRPSSIGSRIPSMGGNQLFIRAFMNSRIQEMYFVFVGNSIAFELKDPASCQLFSFVNNILANASPQPVAIKETSPHKLDFTSLCMTFLSHELNRATYYIGGDLCFQQTPTEIALSAFRDKGFSSDEETLRIISRTLSIHEQRYQNQYKKKKPTYRIMTLSGCSRFLSTGETTDHFVGFRPFTPLERKIIFGNMLKAAKENRYFIPLLLSDSNLDQRYSLVCYEKLGVSIDAKDTDYDIFNGYRSVFLMLPEFTDQYMEYYLDILVRERCYSRQRSLEILEELYHTFLKENDLTE
ncbi:MAG: hypothetical protein IKU70_08580 [Clostridia bacterium]|nr:hypothetical protein [Clostridia bacterium]